MNALIRVGSVTLRLRAEVEDGLASSGIDFEGEVRGQRVVFNVEFSRQAEAREVIAARGG